MLQELKAKHIFDLLEIEVLCKKKKKKKGVARLFSPVPQPECPGQTWARSVSQREHQEHDSVSHPLTYGPVFPFFGALQCEVEEGGWAWIGWHGSMTEGWRKTTCGERQRLKTKAARNE